MGGELQYSGESEQGTVRHGRWRGRHGLFGHFQASPWPSAAPRPCYTFLPRVAMLLIGSYKSNRHRRRFLLPPPFPPRSPAGEIHRRPAITVLSISPRASPRPCASLEPTPSQPHKPQSLNRRRPPQVRQGATATRLVVASRLHCPHRLLVASLHSR
jgi:hypothetical protein